MRIKWIKDADTGELYPMQDDFDFELPAHLDTPEYTTVDYDKKRKMTIEQLQNQLIAAQNHIEAIESEQTSDNNSVATVNEVYPEIVSKSGFKDFLSEWYPAFILIGVCLLLFVLGFFAVDYLHNNGADVNFSHSSENKSSSYEITPIPEIGSAPIYSSNEGVSFYLKENSEQPQEQQETEQEQSEISLLQNSLLYVVRFFLPIVFAVFSLKILFKVVRRF